MRETIFALFIIIATFTFIVMVVTYLRDVRSWEKEEDNGFDAKEKE